MTASHLLAFGVTFFVRERIPLCAALIMTCTAAIMHGLAILVGHCIAFRHQLRPFGRALVRGHCFEPGAPVLATHSLNIGHRLRGGAQRQEQCHGSGETGNGGHFHQADSCLIRSNVCTVKDRGMCSY